MAHKKTLKTINIEREKVLMKGYANIADIKKLRRSNCKAGF